MKILGSILVTGGSSGIDAAIVEALAGEDYDVCLTSGLRHAANQLVVEVQSKVTNAYGILANSGDGQAAMQTLGKVPNEFLLLVGLVNNAGIAGPVGSFPRATPETMQEVFAVNLTGTMLLTLSVARHWRANSQGGSIVNTSSLAATLGAPGEYVHYAASKAAVEGFTGGLAKELAEFGIRVDAVSPRTAGGLQ